jgi:chorismate-pyruvate lyase
MLLHADGTVTALLEACFGLPAGDETIGHVLQGPDTRREVLARDCGEATAADERELGVDRGELVHSRTYRILSGARPTAVVNERIPASVFDR